MTGATVESFSAEEMCEFCNQAKGQMETSYGFICFSCANTISDMGETKAGQRMLHEYQIKRGVKGLSPTFTKNAETFDTEIGTREEIITIYSCDECGEEYELQGMNPEVAMQRDLCNTCRRNERRIEQRELQRIEREENALCRGFDGMCCSQLQRGCPEPVRSIIGEGNPSCYTCGEFISGPLAPAWCMACLRYDDEVRFFHPYTANSQSSCIAEHIILEKGVRTGTGSSMRYEGGRVTPGRYGSTSPEQGRIPYSPFQEETADAEYFGSQEYENLKMCKGKRKDGSNCDNLIPKFLRSKHNCGHCDAESFEAPTDWDCKHENWHPLGHFHTGMGSPDTMWIICDDCGRYGKILFVVNRYQGFDTKGNPIAKNEWLKMKNATYEGGVKLFDAESFEAESDRVGMQYNQVVYGLDKLTKTVNDLIKPKRKAVDALANARDLITQSWNQMRNDGYDMQMYDAETFAAPLVGKGAVMDIGKDTDLGAFTTSELTKSSAIHGDFEEASLGYSGHQNIAVRKAETFEARTYPDAQVCSECQNYGYWDDNPVCPMCRFDTPEEAMIALGKKEAETFDADYDMRFTDPHGNLWKGNLKEKKDAEGDEARMERRKTRRIEIAQEIAVAPTYEVLAAKWIPLPDPKFGVASPMIELTFRNPEGGTFRTALTGETKIKGREPEDFIGKHLKVTNIDERFWTIHEAETRIPQKDTGTWKPAKMTSGVLTDEEIAIPHTSSKTITPDASKYSGGPVLSIYGRGSDPDYKPIYGRSGGPGVTMPGATSTAHLPSPSDTIPDKNPSWIAPVAAALGLGLGFFGIKELKKRV